jgi:hypothetical protein
MCALSQRKPCLISRLPVAMKQPKETRHNAETPAKIETATLALA